MPGGWTLPNLKPKDARAIFFFILKKNIALASFGLRFGSVHPPGIGADLEQSLVDHVPVVFLRIGIERIVKCLVHRMERRSHCLRDEISFLIHVIVSSGPFAEK